MLLILASCSEFTTDMGNFYIYIQLPDYHEIIEQPMDFGTVRSKLNKGLYANLEELEVSHWLFIIKRSAFVV